MALRAAQRFVLIYCVMSLVWLLLSYAAFELKARTLQNLQIFHLVLDGAFFLVSGLYLAQLLREQFALSADRDHQFEMLFMRSPLPVWVYDLKTLRFLEVNNATVEKYGFTREEFLTMTVLDIRPNTEAERLKASLKGARTGQAFLPDIWIHRTKEGALFEVEVAFQEMMFRGITSRVVVVNDITDRRRAQAETLRNTELQNELNREIDMRRLRGRLTSMLAHEFRNPLATIGLSVENLARYADRMDAETISAKTDGIQEQLHLLVAMVDDLAMVMKTDAVGPEFQPEPLNINELAEKWVAQLRPHLPSSHQLVLECSEANIHIRLDPKLMRTAVMNLLTNAVKYSPEGGEVRLYLLRQDSILQIQVIDQGIGIPAEALPRLSEPFYRADNVGSLPGTGLGLMITRQAVELHGGSFEIQSTPGVGTTVTLRLPLDNRDL
jgi:PAS domain S-box-containing protein